MKNTRLSIAQSREKEDLLPKLLNQAFHVTCWQRAELITRDGHIRANGDAGLKSVFSANQGFFAARDHISVFDFRSASSQQIDDSLWKCSPWQIADACGHHLAIFFLSAIATARLVSWEAWKSAGRPPQNVVPFVEAGYPGELLLTEIDELCEVTIEYEENDLVRILRAGSLAPRA